MKLFSDCSGECCVCACGGGCLAGHGDDDFYPATKEQVMDRLDKAQYKDYKDYMLGYLAGLGCHYDVARYGSKKEDRMIGMETLKVKSKYTEEEILANFTGVDFFGNTKTEKD